MCMYICIYIYIYIHIYSPFSCLLLKGTNQQLGGLSSCFLSCALLLQGLVIVDLRRVLDYGSGSLGFTGRGAWHGLLYGAPSIPYVVPLQSTGNMVLVGYTLYASIYVHVYLHIYIEMQMWR